MAFEIKDWFHSYTNKGGIDGLFNVAREDSDNEGLKFYAWFNENGSYIIMRQTTSGTLKIYEYYGNKDPNAFSSDFTGRTALTYVEYYNLFHQTQ